MSASFCARVSAFSAASLRSAAPRVRRPSVKTTLKGARERV
jgi:hypothetical protein